ncbi:uncharacterized protein EV422DRAFT_269884 [Fimicolochytrium jonesii]|uniref:uncharacterized protein n=1 Tax=Fimicolochytrium jonesii TaxID=1396493 RepID=UPI0022FECA20|nr:uncharacterized protein EV422DRAFT_269884 [Fimicolochytrium jonesii]KAI8816799.1 hypothetical protein EV422DRAFT_269884 [Fimicolochytrium jonesii]
MVGTWAYRTLRPSRAVAAGQMRPAARRRAVAVLPQLPPRTDHFRRSHDSAAAQQPEVGIIETVQGTQGKLQESVAYETETTANGADGTPGRNTEVANADHQAPPSPAEVGTTEIIRSQTDLVRDILELKPRFRKYRDSQPAAEVHPKTDLFVHARRTGEGTNRSVIPKTQLGRDVVQLEQLAGMDVEHLAPPLPSSEKTVLDEFYTAIGARQAAKAWEKFRKVEADGATADIQLKYYNALLYQMVNFHHIMKWEDRSSETVIQNMEWVSKIMQQNNVAPDVYTYAYFVRAYGLAGNLDKVREYLSAANSQGFVLKEGRNFELLALAKTNPAKALDAFQAFATEHNEGKGDRRAFKVLLHAFIQHKDHPRFKRTLQLGRDYRIPPDADDYDALIHYYAVIMRNPKEAEALMSHRARRGGYGVSVKNYATLISAYATEKTYPKVIDLFREMDSHSLPPGIKSYNAILNAFCQTDDVRRTVMMFFRVRRDPHVAADQMTWRILGEALHKWKGTFGDLMRSVKLIPTPELYKFLITGLLQANCTLSTARLCTQYRLQMEINNNAPYTPHSPLTYIEIELRNYARHGHREQCEDLWNKYIKDTKLENQNNINAMIALYATSEAHDIVKMNEMIALLTGKGYKPTIPTYENQLKAMWNFTKEPLTPELLNLLRQAVHAYTPPKLPQTDPRRLFYRACEVLGDGDMDKGWEVLHGGGVVQVEGLKVWKELGLEVLGKKRTRKKRAVEKRERLEEVEEMGMRVEVEVGKVVRKQKGRKWRPKVDGEREGDGGVRPG